jgi:hypothetical protein
LDTNEEFKKALEQCKDIFQKKTIDYGTAWRILRPSSLTDQLFIKAKRIRSIQEKGEQKVSDSIDLDFVGLINYSIMALIQLEMESDMENLDLDKDTAMKWYNEQSTIAFDLMRDKNHDYGEAWRDMRVSSITDLILMKLLRIKQIEDNVGKTIISEGLDANYLDIINYSVFALILLNTKNT